MMFLARNESRLPQIRRTAGQSLRESRDRLMDSKLIVYVFAPAMIWVVCLTQWLQVWNHTGPTPRLWTCLGLIVTGLSAIGLLRLVPQARNLVRGEKGELKAAEALEELRSVGYRVFHDLVRNGFNIDHVVVGPGGVFAVETKFRGGSGEIEFRNGEGLFVGGFLEEKDSLRQARGNAREMRQFIKENCGLNCWVNPLVVFVGDWRVKNRWRETDARVLTADQIGRFFDQRQPELTKNEIKLIASHLERSVRG